jgi:diacylglycerol kinase (ATP)
MRIIRSFRYALRGLWFVITKEQNARIHLLIAVVAVILCLWLKVTSLELAAVSFSIVLVFVAEILNSAIEQLANIVTTKDDPRIRVIKDITAAAVLVCASAAVVIGAVVLLHHT